MERFGYHGRIAIVDLGSRSAQLEELDDRTWRRYAGGGLLATYLLMRGTKPGIDAFDPSNLLVISSSVMAGQPYVGLARCTFAGKSPLTGGIGETRCDGPFAHALKGSGVDAIVVQGRSVQPVYLAVENGTVSFHECGEIWGTPVSAANDWLERRHGQDIHTALIGIAGENLVRFASVVSDRAFQAPRAGLGAVMGSKNLKGVVVIGDRHPPVADPERCQDITERYAARMLDNPLTRWQYQPPGFSAWVHTHGTDAALCVRNYQDSVFAGAEIYQPDAYMKAYLGDGICPGCPNNCFKFFGAGNDAEYDPRAGAIHQEITGSMGPNLGIADVGYLFRANILCNELGLDPTSLGFTLSMAMECVERGLLQEHPSAPIRFGDPEGVLRLVRMIARRQGVGDLLAEGSKRAAAVIGGGAERLAMEVKGLELAVFEPRTQTNLALGYATAPIGPRFDICEHDWDYDLHVGWPHTLDGSRTLGILERVPMQEVSRRKVRNYRLLNTVWSGCDALDLNIYAAAPTRALRMEEMAELLSAVTGWDASSWELMQLGERRNQLMRVYNLREGLGAADDTLPDRFFDEPIRQGNWTGQRIDRSSFAGAIATYYRMMGWDELGRPSRDCLIESDLEWVANEGHYQPPAA